MASSKPPIAPPPQVRSKVRVRLVDFEMEGSNEAILESIRQLTSAMTPRTVIQTLAAPPPAAMIGTDEASPDPLVEEAGEAVEVPAEPAPAAPRPRKARSVRPPDLATDLRIDDEPMPLAKFLEGTTVTAESSLNDKTIAVATWLRDHRQKPEMTGVHLYTVCKLMDWDPPNDLTSPMRNLKNREAAMDHGSEASTFVLTLVGDKAFKKLRKSSA